MIRSLSTVLVTTQYWAGLDNHNSQTLLTNTNAQILSAIAEYEPPAPENRTKQDTDESIQRHLILRGLMQLLASYPNTLLYDNDDSLFEVDDVNNDAPMA